MDRPSVPVRWRAFRLVPVILLLLAACGDDAGPASGDDDDGPVTSLPNYAAWPMHPIDARFRGANALMPGDVDGDGRTDYVTNYEFDQRYVISFHPAPDRDPRLPWPTVVAFAPSPSDPRHGVNPEHAALGDFDGDGNLDVVGAQGESSLAWWEGNEPGVRLIWGPPADRAADESAWVDGGRIPATIGGGHPIYVLSFDVNGDGATDILGGGRVDDATGETTGILWIEAPADPAARRDLDRWVVHAIDPAQTTGHGMVLDDVDQDGDRDIVLANADFDTPEEDEKVLWYENPGTGSPAQMEPWPIHVVYQGSEFHGKPQVVAADLDRDGSTDLVTQVESAVYWFRKTGTDPVTFEWNIIPRDPVATWPVRTTAVADINGDGKPDVVGMLLHIKGMLPGDKAAAYWMEYAGDDPAVGPWSTHVIKWGSGRTMAIPEFGEKWDQIHATDVDGDGDVDLVANCEEWWADGGLPLPFWNRRVGPATVAVAWFENRVGEPPRAFVEQGGACVVEAEHFTDLGDGTWVKRAVQKDFGGDGYLQDHRVLTRKRMAQGDSKGAAYALDLAGGTYFIWARRFVAGRWGWGLGGDRSNAAWLLADGVPIGETFDDRDEGVDRWTWVAAARPVAFTPGRHVLNLRAAEGGYAVDRFVLTTDAEYRPGGVGPEETP